MERGSQARGVSTGFEDTDTYILRRVNLLCSCKLTQTERDILEKSVYDDFKKIYAQAKQDFFHVHYDLPLSKMEDRYNPVVQKKFLGIYRVRFFAVLS